MYSLQDLIDLANDVLLPELTRIHASFALHIKTDCEVLTHALSHSDNLIYYINNNNNIQDNVYGAVIMAEPLREFTRFI